MRNDNAGDVINENDRMKVKLKPFYRINNEKIANLIRLLITKTSA